MRKLVFLDFDGVLNHFACKWERHPIYHYNHWGIVPELVEVVNGIVDAVPDVEFVVSSTWRESYTVDELNTIIADHGGKFKFVGATPVIRQEDRGNEIRQYILRAGIIEDNIRFVVVDDSEWKISTMIEDYYHKIGTFVRTSYNTGITLEDTCKIIKHLA